MITRRIRALACAVAACGAQAGNLQVGPVSLQFTPTDKAQMLWLTNSGQQTLHAHVRVFRWTQTEDEDKLEPTEALVPSPPLVEVGPGKSQLVRVVRRLRAAGAEEESFRLIVDEIPSDRSAQVVEGSADGGPPGSGLRLLLRYSLPVFVGGERAAPSSEPASLPGTWVDGSAPFLVITNTGRRRMQVSQVVHEDPQGRRTMLVPGLLGYVLAGQRRRWEMPVPAAQLGPGTIKARLHEAAPESPVAAVRRAS